MDHGHMDHDMPGMDHGHKCNMNVSYTSLQVVELRMIHFKTDTTQMLFTWDTTDLCVVFRSWHISGTFSLIVALIGIILLTAGYEAVREASRRYEAHSNKLLEGRRSGDDLRGKSHTLVLLGAARRMDTSGGFPYSVYHTLERQLSPARDKMCSTPMNRAHCFTQGEMREAMRSSRRSS